MVIVVVVHVFNRAYLARPRSEVLADDPSSATRSIGRVTFVHYKKHVFA